MKISRNDPCPCGSGKKYKKCCDDSKIAPPVWTPKIKEHFFQEPVPTVYDMPTLSKEFFSDHDTNELSAHQLLYSYLLNPEIESLAAGVTNAMSSRGKTEAASIRNCANTSELIDLMKGGIDPLNNYLLKTRLLECPKEAVSKLLQELKQSTQTGFVEIAIRIMAEAKIDVSAELIEIIERHEKPIYQLSIMCLLLGFYDYPKNFQFMWSHYLYLRDKFPDTNYWRGPFYGLWEYWERNI